ncbi:CxC2 domain-containing protein [Mycena indigotica]|uniref:CxC2 domain-containing protein n=1 Tax=Mycena indigotica TaxID=2126181 RepID=A0A8H6SA80_9AGAR|nr:CxC2 domain-containing protein [Mycena indigotica]KAF7294627.1 CxC2 domain-containing protein [Mycena indigotica]
MAPLTHKASSYPTKAIYNEGGVRLSQSNDSGSRLLLKKEIHWLLKAPFQPLALPREIPWLNGELSDPCFWMKYFDMRVLEIIWKPLNVHTVIVTWRQKTLRRISNAKTVANIFSVSNVAYRGMSGSHYTPSRCGMGTFWVKKTLQQIGLVYQLGHGGFRCPFPDLRTHEMIVIDLPFIHKIDLRYCNCPHSRNANNVQQILRNAWYPATVLEPATCTTFRTLKAFRLFNVVGNLNVTDFITALERMSSAMAVSGVEAVPQPTRQFHRMSRQWAHLSRLKRSGRTQVPVAIDATPLGACAVLCWACPQENKNLPPNWRAAPLEMQFLYMMVLAMDANFRLKNRIRNNEIDDPPLGPGWAYWVEPNGYQEHVKKYMSSCIAFAALLQKDTRMTTGLRVSGVGGCVCARHEIVRPNGLGDLQKGERYCNMDWILFSAIMALTLLWITISYDIACQWKVHLNQRMMRLPSNMTLDPDATKVQFGLPIWHAESHTKSCRDTNKLDYKPGVAKTDGEAIERVWSVLNPAALATKEMGLGNRADTLDDRVDNHNFLKNMMLGTTLQRRLLIARNEQKTQIEAFQSVCEAIEPDLQKEWKMMIHNWEADNNCPNPYVLPTNGLPTEADIRHQLQQEERQQNTDGRAQIAERLKVELKEAALLSSERKIKIDEKRDALLRKINRFRQLQVVYMPGVAPLMAAAEIERDSNVPALPAEEVKLWMPSQMPRTPDGVNGCLPGLVALEERLRVSQCENTLSQLRFTLHGKRWLIAYRNAHVTGQRQTTKSAKLIQSVGDRATGLYRRYWRGYTALSGLNVLDKYPQLRELRQQDVRLENDIDVADMDASRKLASTGLIRGARLPRTMPSRSRQVLSWIWTAPGAFADEERSLHETMRVEWSRALARKRRWTEEVLLVEEEMRRVLRFLTWEAKWWRAQVSRAGLDDSSIAAGLRSYALRRASQNEQIMMHFRIKWAVGESRALREIITLDSIADMEATVT